MSDIAEYFTVVSRDPDGLDHAVTQSIEEGYQPFGQPYVSAAHEVDVLYHQAMVRRAALMARSSLGDDDGGATNRFMIED